MYLHTDIADKTIAYMYIVLTLLNYLHVYIQTLDTELQARDKLHLLVNRICGMHVNMTMFDRMLLFL